MDKLFERVQNEKLPAYETVKRCRFDRIHYENSKFETQAKKRQFQIGTIAFSFGCPTSISSTKFRQIVTDRTNFVFFFVQNKKNFKKNIYVVFRSSSSSSYEIYDLNVNYPCSHFVILLPFNDIFKSDIFIFCSIRFPLGKFKTFNFRFLGFFIFSLTGNRVSQKKSSLLQHQCEKFIEVWTEGKYIRQHVCWHKNKKNKSAN